MPNIRDFKRMGMSLAMAVAMVALCVSFGASSRRGDPGQPREATMHRAGGQVARPGHGEHPAPWAKIIVFHAISIATYMGA